MNEKAESAVTAVTDAVAEAARTVEEAANATMEPFKDAATRLPELPFADADFRGAVRSLAEEGLEQTHRAFEQTKTAFEETTSAFELVADRTQKTAAAFNATLLDQTKANMSAGFEHLRRLATAKTLPEVMALQSGFAKECAETLAAQAKTWGEMTSKFAEDVNAPLRDHMSRSFSRLQPSA